MSRNIAYFALFGSLVLSGCLKTRVDVEELENKKRLQSQVVNLQRSSADTSSRFSDIETNVQRTGGRIEVLENRIEQIEKNAQQKPTESEDTKRLKALEETVGKLDNQIQALVTEVIAIKSNTKTKDAGGNNEPANQFENAEALFRAGNWKDSILAYEEFRKANPKSKKNADATYKIGVCFQEMGMKEDAKSFYEEVIKVYAGTEEAKKAAIRLKKVKK